MSLILGMGMSITACYVLVAVILAPALISAGIDPFAAHLFVLYFGMASYITPPFCPGSLMGATIAGADPMKTALRACFLGIAVYLVPFFFVLDPVLILRGPVLSGSYHIITGLVGLGMLASALEKYLMGVGRLNTYQAISVFTGGILLMLPYCGTDVLALAILYIIFVTKST